MQALHNRAVNVTEPTYERTWEEIHALLDIMSRCLLYTSDAADE